MNIFIGENAQGKTNILESICVLALTKTYRYGIEENLISFGKNKAKIVSKVKKGRLVNTLEIDIEENSKKIMVNNQEIKKVSDYISSLNVILFTPEDLEIIKGSPNIRRNLINIELSQVSKKYLNTYNEYNKILKMRNEYLKMMLNSSKNNEIYIEIITNKLIEKAIIIYKERKKFIDKINENINSIYKNITGDDELRISYETNISLDNFEEETIKNTLSDKLKRNYQKEINYGMTLYGPHRDDFSFYLNDNNLKNFGSQGQKKIAVLSFKLSEIDIFKEYSGENPVLLLDDIFSELDIKKRNRLLDYINKDIQSIITTTDLKSIRKKNIEESYIFEIKNKEVERRQ